MNKIPKYYLYVSDTKVDMLFSQIPPKLAEHISTELKLDIKLVSLSLKKDSKPETRYSKLNVVIEYLNQNNLIGTINSPLKYISANIPLAFTVIRSTAVFCGRKEDTMIGLTGSANHLTGGHSRPPSMSLDSISHMVIGDVAQTLAQTYGESPQDQKKLSIDTSSALAFVSQRIYRRAKTLEFVARIMDIEDVTSKKWGTPYREHVAGVSKVILASPLYVSLPE